MKLKGEKELLAEQMYDAIDLEYEELINELSSYISDLQANKNLDILTKINEIADTSEKISLYRLIYNTLYDIDLSEKQFETLNNIAQGNRLLKSIMCLVYHTEYKNINILLIDSIDKYINMLAIINGGTL